METYNADSSTFSRELIDEKSQSPFIVLAGGSGCSDALDSQGGADQHWLEDVLVGALHQLVEEKSSGGG